MSMPPPPYYAVIFSSRRTADDDAGYAETAEAMERLARRQPPPFVNEIGFTLPQAVLLSHVFVYAFPEFAKVGGFEKAKAAAAESVGAGLLVLYATALHDRKDVAESWNRLGSYDEPIVAMRNYMLLGELRERVRRRNPRELRQPLLSDGERETVEQSLGEAGLFAKEIRQGWEDESKAIKRFMRVNQIGELPFSDCP